MTMTTPETADPRYPIGKLRIEKEPATAEQRRVMISQVAETPARLREAVRGLTDQQLDTPYREGGWTVRQVIHHLPDSHLNAYVRMKLGLTEDNPPIKTYEEGAWAELPDSRDTPVEVSLTLLETLHARWDVLHRSMTDEQWNRTIQHPDWGTLRLDQLLTIYAWHGRHHVAHVTRLKDRMGW